MQHFLKRLPASARAWIVPAELLNELLVAVNDAGAAFHACFGRETLSDACSSARKQFSSSKSFIWCMVNLLPVVPFDGGHMFKEVVSTLDLSKAAINRVTYVCAGLMAVLFLVNVLPLLRMLAGYVFSLV